MGMCTYGPVAEGKQFKPENGLTFLPTSSLQQRISIHRPDALRNAGQSTIKQFAHIMPTGDIGTVQVKTIASDLGETNFQVVQSESSSLVLVGKWNANSVLKQNTSRYRVATGRKGGRP